MRMMQALLWVLVALLPTASFGALPKNVAVVVYPQAKGTAPYARIALSRLEQILTDNGVTVLDQAKAEDLKKNWKKLEDPGALITAEEFVSVAKKYAVDGVFRIYLDTGLTRGLANVFTATALTDIRFVGEDAKVLAAASPPMGVKGMPPSDGLTESAAISNAIQRSVDITIQQLGYKVLDFTNPRLFSVKLQEKQGAPGFGAEPRPAALSSSDPVVKLAKLADDDWLSEEITCAQKSGDGKMAVLGGYIRQTTMNMRGGPPQRAYGSKVHIVDTVAQKEVLAYVTAPVAERTRHEKGGSKILDCMFLGSWRYLAAATESKLFLWDTERGTVMSELAFDEGLASATLEYGKAGEQDFLAVATGGGNKKVYQIVRE
jgi:hypothetical protein